MSSRGVRLLVCNRICSSQSEIERILDNLKTLPYPHCKRIGNLAKHGFLMGYYEQHQLVKTARARRVYCTKRVHLFKVALLVVYQQNSRDHAWVLSALPFLRESFGVRFHQTISPS